jgi:chromosome segregation ATPase
VERSLKEALARADTLEAQRKESEGVIPSLRAALEKIDKEKAESMHREKQLVEELERERAAALALRSSLAELQRSHTQMEDSLQRSDVIVRNTRATAAAAKKLLSQISAEYRKLRSFVLGLSAETKSTLWQLQQSASQAVYAHQQRLIESSRKEVLAARTDAESQVQHSNARMDQRVSLIEANAARDRQARESMEIEKRKLEDQLVLFKATTQQQSSAISLLQASSQQAGPTRGSPLMTLSGQRASIRGS